MAKKTATITLSVILAVVLIIAVAAVFLYISSQVQNNSLNSHLQASELNISSSASVFDAHMHDLFDQNIILLIDSSRRSLDSSSAANASYVAFQNNVNQIGNLLTPIYGSNSSQLVSLLNNESLVFLNYSIELRNNNSNAITDLNNNAAVYEQADASFWVNTNNPYPAFDQASMQELITIQMNDVEAAINDWNAGNYTNYYNDEATAYSDSGYYIDTIAQGIIEQNPEFFQSS